MMRGGGNGLEAGSSTKECQGDPSRVHFKLRHKVTLCGGYGLSATRGPGQMGDDLIGIGGS